MQMQGNQSGLDKDMTKINICGTQVVVSRKKKTRTVNICNELGRNGIYDWIVRFDASSTVSSELTSADFSSIRDLVVWLKEDKNGTLERVPPVEDVLLTENRKSHDKELPEFSRSVIPFVESGISRLVQSFLQHPYQHRCEHNLHSELYKLFFECEALQQLHQLASGDAVQLIHREWPEIDWKDRLGPFDLNRIWPPSGKSNAPVDKVGRGLFDLAILSPESLEECTEVDHYLIPQMVIVFQKSKFDGKKRLKSPFHLGLQFGPI